MRAQCCICADLFENSPTVNIAASPCGHTFHEECLMRWMDTSSTCPSCRIHLKKNQIIKRLYFDIREGGDEDEDVDRLHNEIGNLKAQLTEREKQKQQLAESRDHFSTQFVASEAVREELCIKLNEEQNVRDVMQRDLKVLRKENAAFIEEMKEFRKTQRRVQELQNVEAILKGCESDVQDMVCQYSEGGEASVKQLASLLTVVKREYNQVLADKKVLREQVSKLQRDLRHYHSEAHKYKQKVKELQRDLEKTNESLSQVEKDNNENRRRLVHLRNAVRHNKTDGSLSFHRALNEDSPNVAYTPPKFLDHAMKEMQDESEKTNTPTHQNLCLTPDLFDDSPVHRRYLKRKCFDELDGRKLKFSHIPTAAERLQASRQSRSEAVVEGVPKVPQSMLSILQKKLTGQSNSRAHVPSVITRGYDGFGGSTTCVHPQARTKDVSLKFVPRKNVSKKDKLISSKMLTKQPQINSFAQASCPSSSSFPTSSRSSSSSLGGSAIDKKLKYVTRSDAEMTLTTDNVPKKSSTLLSWNIPKLSSGSSEFIDLT